MPTLQEGDICPMCSYGRMLESDQRDDDGKSIYLSCSECESVQLNYVPLPHQDTFHADPAKVKGFFGGYGSGKTRTGAEEVTQHILSTPNGMTLIGAETKNQLDQTAKDMFFKIFPDFMIEEYWKQKDMVLCKNGHTVIFRPLDDEGKLRSLNLTAFWIEEASEVKFDIFVQLQTRLRNKATKHHLGILTSNPDQGWIRTEVLLKAARIENAERAYYQDPDEINPFISAHIAPTHLNTYLPPDYVDSVGKNKPEWWVRRFLHGSFEFSEGMVYPNFAKEIVDPFSIPKHWDRLTATDFGLRDPTVMLALAIDPNTGVAYVYKEHYENGKSIKHHAQQMKEKILNEIPQGRVRRMVGDPKGRAKSEKDLRSTFDYYAEYDIYFEPGINKIEDGVLKVFSYFEMGKLKIFSSCTKTIWEGTKYKYPKQDLMSDKNASEKPVDKDNHAMDCFIAGTLVETDKGQVAIEEVQIGDKVLTREGYKEVINSGIAALDRQTIEVEFKNGSVLIGTPDHLVWTENRGFVALDALRYSDIIKVSDNWGDSECSNQNQSSTREKLTEDIRIFKDRTADILNCPQRKVRTNTSTEKSTEITSEISLKDGTSTTKTVTLTIIHPKTWKQSVRRNMQDIMRKIKFTTKNILTVSGSLQLNGTGQKKAVNGIVNTAKRFLQQENPLKKLADTVEKTMKLKTTENPSFALTNAEHMIGRNVESIMRLDLAQTAETGSRLTSIRRKSIAPMNVVYNLTVQGKPEFYANGILVHNCLRYLIAELPDDPMMLLNQSFNRMEYYGNIGNEQQFLPHALQDDEPSQGYEWQEYY